MLIICCFGQVVNCVCCCHLVDFCWFAMDFDQYRQYLASKMPDQYVCAVRAETNLVQAYQAYQAILPDTSAASLQHLHQAVLDYSTVCMHYGRQWFSPKLHQLHQTAKKIVEQSKPGYTKYL